MSNTVPIPEQDFALAARRIEREGKHPDTRKAEALERIADALDVLVERGANPV